MEEAINLLIGLQIIAYKANDSDILKKCDKAFDEIYAAKEENEMLKAELAELKERVAQDAINSLHGNIGGEYQ